MQQILRENVLNIPNVLTMLRIVLLPVLVFFYRSGQTLAALAVYLAAMLSDVLDGVIARRTNQITALGKLLDPVADKLSLLTILSLFAADGQIPRWVLFAVLAKELLLIGGGILALKKGWIVSALPIGKAATLSFSAAITLRFLGVVRLSDVLLYASLALALGALLRYGAAMYSRRAEKTETILAAT